MSALVPHIRGQLLRPTSRRLQNDGTGSVLRFHAKVLLRTAYFHADVGFCGGRKLTSSDTITNRVLACFGCAPDCKLRASGVNGRPLDAMKLSSNIRRAFQ